MYDCMYIEGFYFILCFLLLYKTTSYSQMLRGSVSICPYLPVIPNIYTAYIINFMESI